MGPPRGMGPMRGMGPSMMARHHATIPQAYAGLTNPVPLSEESLARGAEIYSANCAACHGDGGMGDGPAAANLNPAPAPVAHTSLMLGDSYLFWRISEGGTAEPFNSTMPPWKTTLDEQARWDVINYMRALGSGRVSPNQVVGGATFDPAAENAIRAEILARAVAQNVLTQDEADVFNQIHSEMDRLAASGTFEPDGHMNSREEAMLAELVESGKISQTQADAFNTIHHKLV
ncbi:MAG: c-type cytochrome, partial [Gammaproteobacteria bacterium]|nr:c-type cytochrome [Gammaproteobacteria bacterium]